MSMHEIELTFEVAVSAIGASDYSLKEKRNLYASVYSLGQYFDIGWTLLRNEKELCEGDYLLTQAFAEMDADLREKKMANGFKMGMIILVLMLMVQFILRQVDAIGSV